MTDEAEWEQFAQRFEYMSLDINNVAGFHELNALTAKLDEKYQTGGNRLFYLALAPELFGNVSYNLSEGGLLKTERLASTCD